MIHQIWSTMRDKMYFSGVSKLVSGHCKRTQKTIEELNELINIFDKLTKQ